MKRQLMFGTVFAAALAVGASAQSATATGQQDKDMNKNGETMRITGCLVAADSMRGTTGTSGTASSTAGSSATTTPQTGDRMNASKYLLTDAFVGHTAVVGDAGTTSMGGGSGTGVGTSGAPTTKESTALDRFRLIGGKDEELKEHVNHKVEITGTVEKSDMGMMHHPMDRPGTAGSTTGSTAGSTTGSTASTSGMQSSTGMGMQHDMMMLPRLRVESVRDLGTNCQPNGR